MENPRALYGRGCGGGDPISYTDVTVAREWSSILLHGPSYHGAAPAGRNVFREIEAENLSRSGDQLHVASCEAGRCRRGQRIARRERSIRPGAIDTQTRPHTASSGSEQRGGLPFGSG